MREAGRVRCTTKCRHEDEYTEGVGALKRISPLECAIQAAVHLMRFLH